MSDRQVVLNELSGEDANKRILSETKSQEGIGGLNSAVIKFIEVNDFTTFKAKFAWIDGDLIVQLFLTSEMKNNNGPGLKNYWLNTLPTSLNRVAKSHFSADKPRIQAKYTEELASWWFKAQNYFDRIDPNAFAQRFLELLDQDLEQSGTPFDS